MHCVIVSYKYYISRLMITKTLLNLLTYNPARAISTHTYKGLGGAVLKVCVKHLRHNYTPSDSR